MNFKKKKYHVVISSNERYMPGACVAVSSVAVNARPHSHFVFHLFSEDIREETFEHFKEIVLRLHPKSEVVHHPLRDEDLANLPYWATSRMAAARCLYAEILNDVDWCLYLDCDVLYLASPEEHFNFCDDTKLAIVVQEQSISTRKEQCAWIKENCKVLVPEEEYFNSGVMLFNFNLMRKECLSKKLLEFFNNYKDVPSPDQDALNTLFVGRTRILHPKWNRLQIFLDDKALLEDPVIHYVSGVPWLPRLSTVANGRFVLWHTFADMFIWNGQGESYRHLFSRKVIFLKKVLYILVKMPIVGFSFAFILKAIGFITSAKGWVNNQIGYDVSRMAINKILQKMHDKNNEDKVI